MSADKKKEPSGGGPGGFLGFIRHKDLFGGPISLSYKG